MLSAFDNPNQPPMMSPESQSPPFWRVAQANRNDFMKDPKAQIALAMMQQQLAKMGGMGGGGMMPQRNPMAGFDPNGNMVG